MQIKPIVGLLAAFLAGITVTVILVSRPGTRNAKVGPAVRPTVPHILYYRSPMNPAIHSPKPIKDNMGMAYIPVYAPNGRPHKHGLTSPILYYRSPMNPAIHSPKPMKDNMGMAYIPVYAKKKGPSHKQSFHISRALREDYGVRSTLVHDGAFRATLRAPAIVAIDQHAVTTVNTRVSGWLRALTAQSPGDIVHAGARVGWLYAPAVREAEADYLMLRRDKAGPELLRAARARLRSLGLTRQDRLAMDRVGRPGRNLALYAPITGVVTEVGASTGRYVTPGTAILTIANLHTVWVKITVPPREASAIPIGSAVVIHAPGPPSQSLRGAVNYIYPTLNSRARTVTLRARFANPHEALRPGLYVEATLEGAASPALSIPRSAVLHSGAGVSYVFVADGHGYFHLQVVSLGRRSGRFVEVRSGLRSGERVAVHGEFLLDADSHIHGFAARLQEHSQEAP
ncbi:MAG: efflux RND transporter periplasmic adaptor subunit [Acidiferrobacter sp.]